MKPMGDRVREELGGLVESYVPSPGLPEKIEARTRQRALNHRRATIGATALVVVLVAGAVAGMTLLANSDRGSRTLVSGTHPSTTAEGSVTTVPAVAPPAATVQPAASPPPSFLAAVGGGDEQAVVVDTATGRVVRPISQAPRGQQLWAVSPDGRTLYAPTQQGAGCGRRYLSIDTATGASNGPAFPDLSDLTGIAPAPDGRTLAYTAGCDVSPGTGDVHLRRPDGSTISLPSSGHGTQLSWSQGGTRLALVNAPGQDRSVQVWTVAPTSVAGPHTIAPPDSGCSLGLPRFAGNGLFAVEQCPGGTSGSAPVSLKLVLLDRDTGAEQRSWDVARAPYATVADLAVDPTGGWALYSLSAGTVNGQVSLLALGPAAAKPRVLLRDAYEVAWLPADSAQPPEAPRRVPATPAPTTVPLATTTAPRTAVTPTVPATTTASSVYLPSCTSGAPTTPYFINGCRRPDGSIQPPP